MDRLTNYREIVRQLREDLARIGVRTGGRFRPTWPGVWPVVLPVTVSHATEPGFDADTAKFSG